MPGHLTGSVRRTVGVIICHSFVVSAKKTLPKGINGNKSAICYHLFERSLLDPHDARTLFIEQTEEGLGDHE